MSTGTARCTDNPRGYNRGSGTCDDLGARAGRIDQTNGLHSYVVSAMRSSLTPAAAPSPSPRPWPQSRPARHAIRSRPPADARPRQPRAGRTRCTRRPEAAVPCPASGGRISSNSDAPSAAAPFTLESLPSSANLSMTVPPRTSSPTPAHDQDQPDFRSPRESAPTRTASPKLNHRHKYVLIIALDLSKQRNPEEGMRNSEMNKKGRPTRAGEVYRQAGAVATAVKTTNGLRWEVRRERDGLIRVTKCLADANHWSRA